MNFVIWSVVGGVLGWSASILMKTDGQQGIILNVVVGVVGSMVAGWVITPSWASARSARKSSASPRCWSRCWAPSSF